jgi:phasin family protein
MSNQKQYSPVQQAADNRQANLEKALRIATVMAEANEHLFKLQSEAANAAFTENAKQLKALFNVRESGALIAEWAGRYQANVRRILELTRTSFEIVAKTQAEMAKLVGEPFEPYNKEMQQRLDEFMTAITDERDAAAVAVEDVLAKAMASVSRNNPATKEKVA